MTLSCRVNKTAVLYILSVSSLYCIIKVIHVININYIPKELPNTWRVYNSSYQPRNIIRPVSCQKLILDDTAEQNKAFDYMLHNKPVPKTDDYYIKITSDCANFYRTMGYVMEPLSSDEADFSIAFSILMYRDVEQTERLLRAIYRPQNIYCVHVDVKAEYGVYENMKAIAQCLPNVFLVSKRESVVYASYKRLQAEINCMADLVNFFSHWKYFINLASQSFPTKTMEEIVNILKIYNGANDVEGILEPRIHKSRFEWKYNIVEKSGKYELEKSEVRKQPPPHNIKIVRGSAYGIFSRGFVEYVIHDPVAKDLLEWSKDTYSPDEHYWATLHHLKENPHLTTPGGYKGSQIRYRSLCLL